MPVALLENRVANFSHTLARTTKVSRINRQLILSWQINYQQKCWIFGV